MIHSFAFVEEKIEPKYVAPAMPGFRTNKKPTEARNKKTKTKRFCCKMTKNDIMITKSSDLEINPGTKEDNRYDDCPF